MAWLQKWRNDPRSCFPDLSIKIRACPACSIGYSNMSAPCSHDLEWPSNQLITYLIAQTIIVTALWNLQVCPIIVLFRGACKNNGEIPTLILYCLYVWPAFLRIFIETPFNGIPTEYILHNVAGHVPKISFEQEKTRVSNITVSSFEGVKEIDKS